MNADYSTIRAVIGGLLFGLAGSTFPVHGQADSARTLQETDYPLWGRLVPGKISTKGYWASWRMNYEDGRSLLYVSRTQEGRAPTVLEGATGEKFLGESHLAYLDQDKTLHALSLDRGKNWTRQDVNGFEPLEKYALVLLQPATGQSGLASVAIFDYMGTEKKNIPNVRYWKLSPDREHVALVAEESGMARCLLLRLSDLKLDTVARGSGTGELPAWDTSGRYAAFAQSGAAGAKDRLFLYDTKKSRLHSLGAGAGELFSDGHHIGSSAATGLSIGSDGRRVFFNTERKKKTKTAETPLVEIWSSSDPLLRPAQLREDSYPELLLSCWDIETGRAFRVADTATPDAILTGSGDHAVLWDRLAYEPQFERDSPVDYYLFDVQSGLKRLWLSKRPPNSVFALAGNGKILYREEKWKLYDPKTGSTLAMDIIAEEKDSERQAADDMPVSDISGKWLLMTDGADLWKVATADGKKTRLTFGREKGLAYRLPDNSQALSDGYGPPFLLPVNLSKPIMLRVHSRNGTAQGFSELHPGGKMRVIAFDTLGHSDSSASSDQSCLAYITESFQTPRTLMVVHRGQNKALKIFSSNPHQQGFRWGKAEMVHYSVRGRKMQGILYIPDGSRDGRKHPLVTHIYEIQSDGFFKTVLPGFRNNAGFNAANLVAKGYFVFLPDIRHGIGNPGKDAAESLEAALDSVIARYPVDPQRLALIGHSFGGYETAAVIGYTDRFRTAVMGSGMSEALSGYLSVNKNNLKAEFWRYEHGQSRIGRSLFEDPNAYLENSPALAAGRIKTPLLIWTGAEDMQVSPSHSYSMHLALRRLGKRSTLLVYPGEDHSMIGPDTSRDLTQRIEQWLDCFLKDIGSDWIK